MSKIIPTVGRVVWYYPTGYDDIAAPTNAQCPLAAIIAHVWSDSCVNLAVFDTNGVSHSRTSVLLVQEGENRPSGGFCEWMPYQKGQAAKTDELKAALKATPPPVQEAGNSKALVVPVQDSEIPNRGPRVTPADIEAAISSEHYFTAYGGAKYGRITRDEPDDSETLQLLTFAVLVLRNGFTVVGTSACASPENFDADIGRRIARQDAVRQIWPLLGYALRERIADGRIAVSA